MSYDVTVVSHTHWDRAWYCTFQEFRVRLVRLVDRLVDLLETDPTFGVFMLDGQTVILEDYLEVRPQQEKRLLELARQGRISVGPWYVLPDEFLVSPESIIRNLSLGHRMGERYGGALKAGYVPDGFGHIAQLPQILRGFGIDSAFFWRGMGDEELGTEFEWLAPDGSAVTAIFMPWGYHNLSNVGFAIRWGDTSQMCFDEELALAQIRKAAADLQPMAGTPALLLMNGIDHAEAEPRVPALIARANREIPDLTLRHGTILDHLRRVREAAPALKRYRGEFRWGRYSEVLQGVYSTRIHLKQRNHEVENLIERSAEPLEAVSWLAGARPPAGTRDLIWTAWKWLLKNHPHDDIYGSGIDKVHQEMDHRFDQAQQIGDVITRDSIRLLGRRIDYTAQAGIPLFVFNPLGWARRETVVAEIDLDFDDPLREGFGIFDARGEPVPFQVLDERDVVWLEPLKPNRKRRVRAAIPVRVPACGYTTLYIRAPVSGGTAEPGGVWVVGERGAENDNIAVSVEPNGSLTLRDKSTGVIYGGLCVFEDTDDAGDEYSSSPCPNPGRMDSTGSVATVECVVRGPLLAAFQVRLELVVPKALTADRSRRSSETVPLRVQTRLTVYRDSPLVRLETDVENTAADHKLAVLFPTPYAPRTVAVDEAFGVVERAVDLPQAKGWVEDPTPLMHQRVFVDLGDQKSGLAIANQGLPSVEVRRRVTGTEAALTLLRCVGWLSREDLAGRRVAAGPLLPTPGAQCPGRRVFRYALRPHAGDWRRVYREVHDFDVPVTVTRADTHEGMVLKEMPFIGVDPAYAERTIRPIPWPREGAWPVELSVVSLEPEGPVLSALYRNSAGNGLIVRWYNPDAERGGQCRVRVSFPVRAARLVSLQEEPLRDLPMVGSELELSVGPGAIVTLELIPA